MRPLQKQFDSNVQETLRPLKFSLWQRWSKGQGLMEYLLISSLVGIFCLLALKQFGQVLEKRVQVLKTKVVENMKSN